MFGQMGKLFKIGMLRSGRTVKMSKSELIDLVINLYYIKKEVAPEQYKEIYKLYLEISKDKEPIEMDMDKYLEAVNELTAQFKAIAPIKINDIQK
jgi:hypothetical protein